MVSSSEGLLMWGVVSGDSQFLLSLRSLDLAIYHVYSHSQHVHSIVKTMLKNGAQNKNKNKKHSIRRSTSAKKSKQGDKQQV